MGCEGDTCSFTCNTGYELIGSDNRTCQSDGSWSGNKTMCKTGKRCSAVYNIFTIVCIIHKKIECVAQTTPHTTTHHTCYLNSEIEYVTGPTKIGHVGT